jgi:hypothetical protein
MPENPADMEWQHGRDSTEAPEAPEAPEATLDARRAVRLAAISTLVLSACGVIAIPTVSRLDLKYFSLFYAQYAAIELPGLLIIAAFAAATLVLLARSPAIPSDDDDDAGVVRAPRRIWPWAWLLAAGVLLVAVVGTNVVFHRYFLADDEYSAWFQAVIFAHGRWSAAVAPEWCRWITYLTPTTIATPQPCTWHLGFLPIHSMVRAGFMALGIDQFAGPALGAIAVVLTGAIARRLWPDKPRRAWTAMLVLATSTQLLFMSMTMFSMPTHLVFDLVWLWLYVIDTRWSVAVLPWVGVLSLGVHSPTPHLTLVPPFLLRYVRNGRLATVAYMAVVYGIGLVFWRAQLTSASGAAPSVASSISAVAATPGGMFRIPLSVGVYSHTMSATLIGTWNMPLALLCVIVAALAWKRLDTFSRDAILSIALIMAVRAFIAPYHHGEGWGYRYIYSALGLIALLSAVGAEVIGTALGTTRARRLFVAALATAVVIQLPMRAVQTEGIVRPYYRSYEFLSHQKAKIVVFRASDYMWARQLLRNDPFLRNSPLMMDMQTSATAKLPPGCATGVAPDPANGSRSASIANLISVVCGALRTAGNTVGPEVELKRLYPGQVRVVTAEELAPFGMTRFQVPLSFHITPVAADSKRPTAPP